jgi:hypothetical protein
MDSADKSTPGIKGVYWLKRSVRAERMLRCMEIAGFAFIMLLLSGGLMLYVWLRMQVGVDASQELQSRLEGIGYLLLLSGFVMASMIPVVLFATRAMKRKLGTDGKKLHIKLGDGRELSVAPEKLVWYGKAILYRQYSLPVQTGKSQSLYEEGEVETYLSPLLQQAQEISVMQVLRHQWKYKDPQLIWALIFAASVAAVTLLIAVWDVGLSP